jgi:tRNA(Ile)-lysidine synthase
LDRRRLREVSPAAARRWTAAACLSAGGGGAPPRGPRLHALLEPLRGRESVRRTLCGARVQAAGETLLIVRDAGEAARGGLAPLSLTPGEPAVWDGRFEMASDQPGLIVRPLTGMASALPSAERRRLATLPAAVRPGLPVIVDFEGRVTCPILAAGPALARDLTRDRMRAACGAISREAAT